VDTGGEVMGREREGGEISGENGIEGGKEEKQKTKKK